MANKNFDKIRCSFCNKTEDQVRKLIAGPGGVYICDECIDVCSEILEDELTDEELDLSGISSAFAEVLKKGLEGYEAYMERIRWRVIPFIW